MEHYNQTMRGKLNYNICPFKEEQSFLKRCKYGRTLDGLHDFKGFDENCGRIYKIKLPEGVQPGQLVEATLKDGQKFITR